MIRIISTFVALTFVLMTTTNVAAQSKRQKRIAIESAQTEQLITSKNYRFNVETLNVMVPSQGVFQSAGAEGRFWLDVTPDSVVVMLPSFGELTGNNFNMSVPLSFASKKFGYIRYDENDDNSHIVVNVDSPQGVPYTFYLTVSPRSGAIMKGVTLRGISISFDGSIAKIPIVPNNGAK